MVNHFPVFPTNNGGKLRIMNLAVALAHDFDVTILSPIGVKDVIRYHSYTRSVRLGDRSVESDVAGSFLKPILLGPLYFLGYNSVDAFSSNRILDASGFTGRLKQAIKDSALIIMEHPFLSPLIARFAQGDKRPKLIYDAIDVELVSASFQNRSTSLGRMIYGRVASVERMACRVADAVFATTDHDRHLLETLYGLPGEKISTIPIGIDTSSVVPPSENEKAQAKAGLGMKSDTVLVTYLASSALHNVKVLDNVLKLASGFASSKNVRFYVGGSVAAHVAQPAPPNVMVGSAYNFGDSLIYQILQASDVAISIDADHKTGTPVKTLEYMAHGLPAVVTEDESERIGLTDGVNASIASKENMGWRVRELIENPATRNVLGAGARKFVVEHNDSAKSGDKALSVIRDILI